MIELERASRWYGRVIGLNDVSCQIGPGVTALLGPNGAGKSTLLKLITGQLRPTTGTVRVLGEAPFGNLNVFRQIGYCPEIDNLYEDLTGREMVTQLGAMGGLSGSTLKDRVQSVMERVGMADRCDRKVGGYSKGMRQRIKVAQGIIHDPKVLILDEPLNGLDPVGRREMTDLMAEYAALGRCVLVSSHILYEVEQMTDSILLMVRGRLLARGSVREIRDQMDRYPHKIAITSERARALAADLLPLPYIVGVRFDSARPNHVEVETSEPERFYAQLPQVVMAGNYTIDEFHSPDNNLESLFRYLIGN